MTSSSRATDGYFDLFYNNLPTVNSAKKYFEQNFLNIDYNLTEITEKWEVTSFAVIAEKIIKVPYKSLPYDDIRQYLYKVFHKQEKLSASNNFNTLKEMELIYIALASIPLLMAMLIIFIVLRRRSLNNQSLSSASGNKRRKRLSEFEVVTKKKRALRFVWASLVAITATLVLISSLVNLFVAERIDSGLVLSKEAFDTSLNKIMISMNLTYTGSMGLLEKNYDQVQKDTMKIKRAISEDVALETVRVAQKTLEPYFDAIAKIDIYSASYLERHKHRDKVAAKVKETLRRLKELHIVMIEDHANRTDFCSHIKHRNEACSYYSLKNGFNLANYVSDYNLIVTNASSQVSLFIQNTGYKHLQIAGEANKLIKNTKPIIERMVNASLQDSNIELVDVLNPAKAAKDKISSEFQRYFDKLYTNFLVRLKGTFDIDEETFSKARVVIAFFNRFATLVFFVSFFLIFMALLLGQFAAVHVSIWEIDELSLPMRWTRTATDLLSSFKWIFYFAALPILLNMSAAFFVASNLTHLCNGLKGDYIIHEIIDNNKTWGGNLFGSLIHNDSSLDIKLSEIMSNCKTDKGDAFWNTLLLDKYFNPDQRIAEMKKELTSYLPSFNATFSQNYTVTGFLSNFTADNMDRFKLGDINTPVFYVGHPQRDRVHEIKKLKRDFGQNWTIREWGFIAILNHHIARAEELARLQESVDNEIAEYNKAVKEASETTKEIEKGMTMLNTTQQHLLDFFNETNFNNFLNTYTAYFVNKKIHDLFALMSGYSEDIFAQLRHSVGQCQVIPDSYDLFKSLTCYYFADSANGMWLSQAIFLVVVLATYKAIFELRSHYEIISLNFESEGDDIFTTTPSSAKLNFTTAMQIATWKDNQWK